MMISLIITIMEVAYETVLEMSGEEGIHYKSGRNDLTLVAQSLQTKCRLVRSKGEQCGG